MEQLSTYSGYLLYGLFPILGALVLVYIVFGIYTMRHRKPAAPDSSSGVVRKKRPKNFGQLKRRKK